MNVLIAIFTYNMWIVKTLLKIIYLTMQIFNYLSFPRYKYINKVLEI